MFLTIKLFVVAERIKFMSIKQETDKLITKYLHRLGNICRYCEFEKLGQEELTIEEGVIHLRLTEGIYNASHRYRIMKKQQIGNISLNTGIDFILRLELTQKYNHDKNQPSEQIFANTYMLKKILKCSYCGCELEIKRKKMPSIWENFHKLL